METIELLVEILKNLSKAMFWLIAIIFLIKLALKIKDM